MFKSISVTFMLCIFLFSSHIANARLNEAVVTLLPYAKIGDKVLRMTQEDAASFCLSMGSLLPTAKEIALALNPEGIIDYPVPGYSLPIIDDESSSFGIFYYESKTYPTSSNGIQPAFWSSTFAYHNGYANSVYQFNNGIFNILGLKYKYERAVRCVKMKN
jgi:hypothetical protein